MYRTQYRIVQIGWYPLLIRRISVGIICSQNQDREFIVRQVEIPPAKAAAFRKLESTILSDEKGAAVIKKQ
ncbi:MAG: hypothetical protein ACLQLH_03270 [Terracidiphilus sp.]